MMYDSENPTAKQMTCLNLSIGLSSLAAFYKKIGAKMYPLRSLCMLESVPNISIGREVFKMLFPDNKFRPILFATSFKTLL